MRENNTPQESQKEQQMPLAKSNYAILLAGFIIIIIGFILMSGGGSDNPTEEFNYAMFSFRRITLAPILVVVGFVVEIYAILKK